MDTSSAQQDDVDIGRDGADRVGGTELRPRGFPTRTTAARQPDATTEGGGRDEGEGACGRRRKEGK